MNKKYSIGQVAKIYDMSTDTLRHYESIDLLKPAGRSKNGYRYYVEEQFFDIRIINTFKGQGVSLKEIKNLLECRDQNKFIEITSLQIMKIKKHIEDLEEIVGILENSNKAINTIKDSKNTAPHIVNYKSRRYISMMKDFSREEVKARTAFLEFEGRIKKHELFFPSNMGLIIDVENSKSSKKYRPKGVFVFVYKNWENVKKKEKGKYACINVRESKHEKAYNDLKKYIKDNNYQINGYALEMPIVDFVVSNKVKDYWIRIEIPVIDKSKH